MFDIGWSELLIIGVVALIVVGPKDLPKMFRTLGQFTGKLRGMAREFTRAMDAAADESGMRDVAKTFRETASGKTLRDAVGLDEIDREFRDIGRDPATAFKPAPKPAATPDSTPASAPAAPAAAAPAPAAQPAPAPDLAARNAAFSETEAERLRRAERAAEARRQAAEIRARRAAEAESGRAAAPTPPPADPQG